MTQGKGKVISGTSAGGKKLLPVGLSLSEGGMSPIKPLQCFYFMIYLLFYLVFNVFMYFMIYLFIYLFFFVIYLLFVVLF